MIKKEIERSSGREAIPIELQKIGRLSSIWSLGSDLSEEEFCRFLNLHICSYFIGVK
ncbi:MAG: hypothetical protein LUQ38_07700 [Methanotrichaceae archaeon]|nr:hypothetical protein [Methanotrichaceae archaeon]